MLPLSMRRERNDIIFFWKCLNGKYEVAISKYVFFSNSIDRCTRSSTDEGFLMKVPFCEIERFRKSYFNRIVYLWNSLPQNVRRDVNLVSLMKDTDQILHVYLNNHFQETTLCCSMFLCCDILQRALQYIYKRFFYWVDCLFYYYIQSNISLTSRFKFYIYVQKCICIE